MRRRLSVMLMAHWAAAMRKRKRQHMLILCGLIEYRRQKLELSLTQATRRGRGGPETC